MCGPCNGSPVPGPVDPYGLDDNGTGQKRHLVEGLKPQEAAWQLWLTLPGITVLCQIAWAATRTTSQFKSRFQGLVIRRGTKKALVVIGHKVLKIVFVLLSRQVPYRDSTVDYAALTVKRNAPRWIRALKRFGYLPQSA
jgi:hypothetical protein